jgi:DNA-binding response OmpR family regulator
MNALTSLRILIIEDDPRMIELLRTGLWEKGHSIVTATSAGEGERLLDENSFDAILLDVGLPDRSGYTVAKHLSARPARPAIVMLTALSHEDNIVCGLDAGADDYLTKPFSFPELMARIAAAARRTRFASSVHFAFGPFRLDIAKRRLSCSQSEIHITHSEYLLLRELAMNSGEVVSRRQLAQAVWGQAPMSHTSLDSLVNTLRGKLNAEQPGLISTIRGRGYLLTGDPEPRKRLTS